jgi:von Willebrand factor type A domain
MRKTIGSVSIALVAPRRRFAAALALGLVCAACSSSGSSDEPKNAMPGSGGSGAGTGGALGSGNAGNAGSGGSAVGSGGTGSGGGGTGSGGVMGKPAMHGATSAADALLTGTCAQSTVQSALLPANILFVIDRTGTMACNPPPITASDECEMTPTRVDMSSPSKWEITSDALIEAMKTLPPTASVGISYFSKDEGCGVNSMPTVPVALNKASQQAAMEASLKSVTPGGGTPLVGATILAYKHLHALALEGSITGNEFVVLITDGEQSEQCSYEPRCTDAQSCYDLLVDQEVPKAAAPGVGIRTFVIGAPGSEGARTVLSKIAQNGGTGAPGCDVDKGDCHFDMTKGKDFGAGLSDALSAIVGQTIDCELPVPANADGGMLDPERLNVVYSPSNAPAEVVPQDMRSACDAGADGWQYSEDMTKIRLCGPTCQRVREDQGGRVDVVIGCPSQGPD